MTVTTLLPILIHFIPSKYLSFKILIKLTFQITTDLFL